MDMKEIIIAVKKSIKGLWNMFPVLLGVLLLINMVNIFISKNFYGFLFQNNFFLDPLFGSILGSIFASNPITSYVIGGELLDQGVSLLGVTSFIVAWVTVGLVQLPAESMMLGKKFAILRNSISFILSIVVSILTVLVVGLL